MQISSPCNKSSRRTKFPRPVALITGASGGIGGPLATAFAAAGYHIIAHYFKNRSAAVDISKKIIMKGGMATPMRADITSAAEVRKLFSKIKDMFGGLDVLVNNAGTNHDSSVNSLSSENWDKVIKTNLNGSFYCLQGAGQLMSASCGGSIVNIGSYTGLVGAPAASNYVASKSALIGLTKSAAKELGGKKICVNLVLPGFHKTNLTRRANINLVLRRAIKASVLAELPPIQQVCRFIVDISEQRYISGQIFSLDSRIT